MPQCPTCGAVLDTAARFCPKDGTTIRADTLAPMPVPEVLFPRDEVGRATRQLTPPTPAAAQRVDESGERRANQPAKPKAKPDDPVVGAIIDGRYRVRARIGEGGVGAVYEGEHVETLRPVAVKVLHAIFAGTEEFHRRFEREARAASRLTHPSCVSVIDFGRVERVEPVVAGARLLGIPYLVMEFVRGQSLADRLEKGKLPATEAVLVARGVLSALKHAHGLGIVHRDIKPANVMLVEGGGTNLLVKLLDFGLAKLVNEIDPGSEPLTQVGMVFGTPGYLSPEQAEGLPADARSDLYGLGIMMYEMVVGERPFVRADPLEVVRDHLQTPPPLPRLQGAQISAELERVILRALAKQPDKRWQSAEELSRELLTVPELGGMAAGLTPAGPLGSAATEMMRTPAAGLPLTGAGAGMPAVPTPTPASSPGMRSSPGMASSAGMASAAGRSSPGMQPPVAERSLLGMVPYGDAPSQSHALGWRARWARLAPLPAQAWGRVRRLPWAAWGTQALRLPRRTWRRAAGLPWSEWLERLGRERRLQAIGAGVAALLILLFVLVTHRGGPPAPPPPEPQPLAAATMAPSPAAQRHLATAVMYQRKLWCSDALEELEQALRNDGALRDDDELQRTAIACLTPRTRDKALRFLVEQVGEPARAPLAAAVVSDPNGEVRRGARMALDRLPPAAP